MKLIELFEANATDTMHNAEADQRGYSLSDTRKPKLTLRELNKLRKYRDFKNAQDLERNATASVVYATPDEAAGGAAPGGF